MTRPDFKKESRGKKEELKYPCSPRSQKWINNLLPVLESYNYNYLDIVKLVKNCDYNAEKIQVEVERIVQMNLGHEQGEWEVVKPNTKGEKATSKTQPNPQRNLPNSSKFKGKSYVKEEGLKKNSKVSPKVRLDSKPEKSETEEDKKELLTSWASLLKRDPVATGSNTTPTLSQNKSQQTSARESINSASSSLNYAPVDSLNNLNPSMSGMPSDLNSSMSGTLTEQRLDEKSRLNDRVGRMRPPVVMPKEFKFSESKLTFGCLEDELWSKPWPDWQHRDFQKPRPTSSRLQSDVFPNYYERKSMVYYDDPNAKKYDRFQVTSNASSTSTHQQPASTANTGSMSSANLSNLTKDNVGFGGGVYFNYPYSSERLQNPPGLVSYYTPQPFYGFGNSNANNNAMKFPECYRECDSTTLNLKKECNLQGDFELLSAEIIVLWASALLTNGNLTHNELLYIARTMNRSEYSKKSVKIAFTNPLCFCRIYSNGRILIMGSITEKQAYKRLAKTVRQIKYRTKWKVQVPELLFSPPFFSQNESESPVVTSKHLNTPSVNDLSDHGSQQNKSNNEERIESRDMYYSDFNKRMNFDGNGLVWKYVDDENILKVSDSLETFKIDQLLCKVVLDKELNLEYIYSKLDTKLVNVNLFPNYLRFQFTLDDSSPNTDFESDFRENRTEMNFLKNSYYDLDISLELERVLETEIKSVNRSSSCLVFKSGKINIFGCVNRSEIIYTFNQLIKFLF
uniref:Uncharacterized protein n=1 Tax=Theileria annulata TaxID=5874 RepID=A0A3B0N0P9_THEAN